jgi:hypothetical protein
MTPTSLIEPGSTKPTTPDLQVVRLHRGVACDYRRDPDTQVRYPPGNNRGKRQSV